MAAATSVVRARVNEDVKDEASAVLAEMGLTLSDLVRLTVTRVAKDRALPFEIKIPNAETRAAIEEGRKLMASGATREISARELIDELDEKAAKPKKSRAAA
ncbi:MAG: type II toxin-antitoxin system RelB/DinJ family antitoxin [Rhizomicrobium sp.]|nr:type II toxin-antitoxin system RelB/DinJ family antitoxin [Rhizomicrobium sp.]